MFREIREIREIRDIAHARVRSSLVGSVAGPITLLLVMLTGLTGGLGARNTSALQALDPDRYVFTPATDGEAPTVSFTGSAVTAVTRCATVGSCDAGLSTALRSRAWTTPLTSLSSGPAG